MCLFKVCEIFIGLVMLMGIKYRLDEIWCMLEGIRLGGVFRYVVVLNFFSGKD